MTRAGTWAELLLATPTANLPRPSSGENNVSLNSKLVSYFLQCYYMQSFPSLFRQQKEGYLFKYRNKLSGWDNRYFKLDKMYIHYYETKDVSNIISKFCNALNK